MRRVGLAVVSLLLVSCEQVQERPALVGFAVNVPEITLDRLDDQLHLRIFSAGNMTCNATLGQVVANGAHVTNYGGQNVNPLIRCDPTMWPSVEAMYGTAMPIDQCFSKSAPAMAQVPPGNYIVLVEGSGAVTGAGGTMPHVLLGAGCAPVMATGGSSQMVSIEMIEQGQTGMCGNGVVEANESCDDGTPDATCDNLCQFPERVVDMQTSAPHRPSLGWTTGQSMLVMFDADNSNGDSRVYLHELDVTAQPITTPPAFANDNDLGPLGPNGGRFQQQVARIVANGVGFAATWQSSEYNANDFDIVGVSSSSDDVNQVLSAPNSGVFVSSSTLSMTTTNMNRTNPVVAVGASELVWLFESGGTVHIAKAPVTATLAMPATDTPLVASGSAMSMASQPVIAATSSGFVAAWTTGPAGSLDVYAAQLDPTGALVGTPTIATVEAGADQDQPAIAVQGSDVVIAWRDDSDADPTDNSGTTIRWRHFSTSLVPMGGDQIAPSTTMGDQLTPTVSIAANSTVLLAWENASDNTIRGRLFQLDGSSVINRITATPEDFAVNAAANESPTGVGPRHLPSAAFGGSNRFGVAWEDNGAGHIVVRTFLDD